MKENIKIAKTLLRIAKELMAANEQEQFGGEAANQINALSNDKILDYLKQYIDLLQSFYAFSKSGNTTAVSNIITQIDAQTNTRKSTITLINDISQDITNGQQIITQGNLSGDNNTKDNDIRKKALAQFLPLQRAFLKASTQLQKTDALLWRLNRCLQSFEYQSSLIQSSALENEIKLAEKVLELLKQYGILSELIKNQGQNNISQHEMSQFDAINKLVQRVPNGYIAILKQNLDPYFIKINQLEANHKLISSDITPVNNIVKKSNGLVYIYDSISSILKDTFNLKLRNDLHQINPDLPISVAPISQSEDNNLKRSSVKTAGVLDNVLGWFKNIKDKSINFILNSIDEMVNFFTKINAQLEDNSQQLNKNTSELQQLSLNNKQIINDMNDFIEDMHNLLSSLQQN